LLAEPSELRPSIHVAPPKDVSSTAISLQVSTAQVKTLFD
jgi:hypothetical protein